MRTETLKPAEQRRWFTPHLGVPSASESKNPKPAIECIDNPRLQRKILLLSGCSNSSASAFLKSMDWRVFGMKREIGEKPMLPPQR